MIAIITRVPLYASLLYGLSFLFLFASPLHARQRFRLVAYNVENLFDLSLDGTEYPGYIPGTDLCWNAETAKVKYVNIAWVLAGTGAQVAVLSEVESQTSLERLQDALKAAGHPMAHGIIASRHTPVRCAVLSTFPIVSTREVRPGPGRRSILRATLDVGGTPVTIYANHWKSKRGPESHRMIYARALVADLATLPPQTDYILAGDFNADFNAWQTFHREPHLNDTGGRTGINHLLHTTHNNAMVTEGGLRQIPGSHYNLWMELPLGERWSRHCAGRKGSLDHILIGASLYDEKGVSYVDGSFGRYAPEALFSGGETYRWQRSGRGKGRHLGKGYSDHLPVYADFVTGRFERESGAVPLGETHISRLSLEEKSVADLYNLPVGSANYRIRGVVVLYKSGSRTVVKSPQGRAIYLYRAGGALSVGWVVDFTVKYLNTHYGLQEVTAVDHVNKRGEVDPKTLLLKMTEVLDLEEPLLRSEVVERVCGTYRGGRLHYGGGRSIRLYLAKGILRPENGRRICLSRGRIGFYKHPELVVDSQSQIELAQ